MVVLLLAAMEAYSRVYPGEHFLEDVAAGAFIGILFGMISCYVAGVPEPAIASKIMVKKKNDFAGNNRMYPV